MPTLPLILVTSAVGNTGPHVVRELLEHGYPVRAFVRRRDERALALEQRGAEIFVGNQYSLSDMRRAMTGVRRAYQCAPTAPNGLHFNAVFTAAAHEAELEHVVTLGQWLSSADHPSLFTREVHLSDLLIRLGGRTTVTSVDPGWFAANYLMVIDMAAHLGLFPMPLGDGETKKNAPPSNEDIASVAVAALVDPQAHAGRRYRPTGPGLLSPNEIAEAMGRALERRVRYMDISERMMTKALRAMPPKNYSEAMASQLAIYADEYRRGAFAVNAPSGDVERVVGRAAEPFERIVQRTVAERPDLRPSLTGSLRALSGFTKMLLTPALDLQRVRELRDHVEVPQPRFCQDDATWLDSHGPDRATIVPYQAA